MRELDECLNIKNKINKLDEKIKELQAKILSPKNQIITGMPRSGGTENAIERALIKLEKLSERKENLLIYQRKKWLEALNRLGDIDDEIIFLLHKRFIEGLKWEVCAKEADKKYGGWNINKVYRIYRKIK